MTEKPTEKFQEWAILELMGHRRLAGRLTEQEIGGGSFLRLDVHDATDHVATQFYSPAAVYCITPTSEAIARSVAARNKPEPVQRWELEPPRDYGYERPEPVVLEVDKDAFMGDPD